MAITIRDRLNNAQREIKQIIRDIYNTEYIDRHACNIAKTNFETGFLWAFNVLNKHEKFQNKDSERDFNRDFNLD